VRPIQLRYEYARERSTCHAMKGHVYILASKRSGTWYTGVTWGPPRRLAIFTVYETRRGARPLHLIPVLVTGIQQRRVWGAGSVLSAQGLGLAGFL
jgi:hypothetical protein